MKRKEEGGEGRGRGMAGRRRKEVVLWIFLRTYTVFTFLLNRTFLN